MNVRKIRAVGSCSVAQLPEVAEGQKLPLGTAKALRTQYRRLLEGRCVVCGKHATFDKCPKCRHRAKGKTLIAMNINQMLNRMSLWSVLARETCTKCKQKYDVRARDILTIIRKEGASRVPTMCPRCSAPPPAKKAPPPAKKTPRKTCLTFRPFEALKMASKCEKREYSLG